MKVLLIEAKASLRERLQQRLIEAGITCDAIDYSDDIGRGALDYDVVVLNMALDGQAVLQRMRSTARPVPVLVLSRQNAPNLRVMALDAGADDFLAIPFYAQELIARLRAIHRRAVGRAENIVQCGGGRLKIDLVRKMVQVEGQRVPITGKQFMLLAALAERKDHAVSKDSCMAQMYGLEEDEPNSKIIDVLICKIRQKLGPAGEYIQTLWGRGYCLGEPDNAVAVLRSISRFKPVRLKEAA